MKRLLIILGMFVFGCNSNNNEPVKIESPTNVNENELAKINPAPKEEENEISPKKEFQTGDLIFHTSTSDQSLAIQLASNSKYSHVGIIYQEGGDTLVLEAIQPVQITPIKTFIDRGEHKAYVVKRLKTSEETLTPEGILKMKEIGKKYLGKNYDKRFEWSDDKIYCSELVWKIYKQAFDIKIGELEQIKDFDLSDPIVKAKAKERYGNNIPLEELIITPDRMFQSDKLVTVLEK
ncbi:MAG: YiiX family permuted papain-like enzyme [Saprospiraceae bacterium]